MFQNQISGLLSDIDENVQQNTEQEIRKFRMQHWTKSWQLFCVVVDVAIISL